MKLKLMHRTNATLVIFDFFLGLLSPYKTEARDLQGIITHLVVLPQSRSILEMSTCLYH